jgi:hypothetical protein
LSWLDELQFPPGPPWHSMGTRALRADEWLLVDEDRDDQLALKRALLRDAHDVVAAFGPGSDAAASEAASLVASAAGVSLEEAAVLVQEDLCVLVRRDGHWRLDAGVVCFPSMWCLPDKLGLPIAAVHEPVPAYASELADRVDTFLDRLSDQRPVWRRNWFIHDSPELHMPRPIPASHPPAVPDGLWLRSERQTLRSLPESGAILFTIRTQQVPLSALADRPDIAAKMAAVVKSWSLELVAYRNAQPWRSGVVAWLSSLR